MFEGEDIAFNGLEVCSYRHLQKVAKGMSLPSNVKKVYLIEMIRAKKYSTEDVLNAIINRIKMERKVNAQTKKKKKRKTFSLQGAEISSTSNSHSPPMSLTAKRPVSFTIQYGSEISPDDPEAVVKYPRNILLPGTSIIQPMTKSTQSDRVLRSFNSIKKPNYRIMNESNCLLSVVKSQNSVQQMRQERTFQSVTIQKHRPMVNASVLVNRERQLVPVSRSANSPKPAKRQRKLSGIYPLPSRDKPFYQYVPSVGFRRQDGRVAKINAVIQTQRPNTLTMKNQVKREPIVVTLQDVINYKVDNQTVNARTIEASERSRYVGNLEPNLTSNVYNADQKTIERVKDQNARINAYNRSYSLAQGDPMSYQFQYQRFNDKAIQSQEIRNTALEDKIMDFTIDQEVGTNGYQYSNGMDIQEKQELADRTEYARQNRKMTSNDTAKYTENGIDFTKRDNQEVYRNERMEFTRQNKEQAENRVLYKENGIELTRLENQELARKERMNLIRLRNEERSRERTEFNRQNLSVPRTEAARYPENGVDFTRRKNQEIQNHRTEFTRQNQEPVGIEYTRQNQERSRNYSQYRENRMEFTRRQNQGDDERMELTRLNQEVRNDSQYSKEGEIRSDVASQYPNMSALTDVFPNDIPEMDRESFSVYYHKKIRGDQVRHKSRDSELLPRINDAFTQFNTVPYMSLAESQYGQNTEQSGKVPVPLPILMSSNTCMLESLYNFKNQFVTQPPLMKIATTLTNCTYSTRTVATAVVSPAPTEFSNNSNPYEQRANLYQNPEITRYEYMNSEGRPRAFGCDEVLSSSTASLDTQDMGANSQEMGANVTIPDMVEDALELISQDGDYMERIGMDVRVQCILCEWAGPKIILEYHVKKEHRQDIQAQDNKEWSVLLTLGELISKQTWSSQLVQHNDSIYVLSAKYVEDIVMVALSMIPSEAGNPKHGRITIYNKISGKPFSYESEIRHLPDSMPYEYTLDCLLINIESLDLIPNSANLKLVNRELVVSSPSKVVVGQPELNNVEIVVYVKLFD